MELRLEAEALAVAMEMAVLEKLRELELPVKEMRVDWGKDTQPVVAVEQAR